MQFADVTNPFGTAAFDAAGLPSKTPTYYYKGQRLERKPKPRHRAAPKPLTHTVKNFLLTYNG
jgi:hypothetical protein